MRRILFSFLVVMTACLPSLSQVQITEAQALQLVKRHRNVTKSDTVNYYIGEVSAVLNETYCPLDSSQLQKSPIASCNNLWLVFADENPRFGWMHGCSYYYIPKTADSLRDVPIFEVKGLLPPDDVILRPIEKNIAIRTPSTRMRQPSSQQITPLPSNDKANDTRVIIMASGDYFERAELNWDYCANLYNVLTKKYLIPKQNFSLLMYDTYFDDETGLPCTFSHDLDGDNIDEDIIDYNSDNIDSVFMAMAQVEMEHLFIFYLGISQYDTGLNYINIGDINEYDWSDYIDNIDASYKNIVLCCDKAELLVDYLLDSNRIITVSNPALFYSQGDGVYPYIFAKPWIDGLAGIDMDSGLPNQADSDGDWRVTTNELYNYALSSSNEGCPLIYSQPNYLKNKLAFNYIPIATDLYIADNVNDKGLEPNYTSNMIWDSPDIWIRNTDDGLVNQTNDHIYTHPDSSVYIYVRVSNFGYSPSYINRYLNLFWSSSALGLDKNTNFATGNNMGNKICAIPASGAIARDGSLIFKYHWTTIPAQLKNQATYHGGTMDMNIFAYLSNSSLSDLPTTQDGLISFAAHKNLAAKKHISLRPALGNAIQLTPPPFPIYGHATIVPILIKNSNNANNTYSIEVVSSASNTLFNKCTQKLQLSPALYSAWVTGGSQGVNITADPSNYTIKLNGTNSKIQNITIAPNQLDSVLLHCICAATPTNDVEYEFSLVMRDATNTIIEGESFDVFISGSAGVGVIIGQVNGPNGSCQLLASGVNEPSLMEWYGPDSEFLGTGEVLQLGSNKAAGEYKLRVVSLKSAEVSYATITLGNETAIDNVSPNPFSSQFTVRLAQPATANMYVRLSPLNGTGRAIEVPVATGEQEVVVSATDYPSGVYALGLSQNGIMIENRIVIKQ